MGLVKDITGMKFGEWTVLGRSGDRHYSNHTVLRTWLCKCSCGTTKEVLERALVKGESHSCGCVRRRSELHRALLHVYVAMLSRCYNKSNKSYKTYGAKGVRVCDEWLKSFESFYEWAISNGYAKGLTIDRINPKGCYAPDNCRWVSMKVQNRNKTNNDKFLGFCQSEWCERFGVSRSLICAYKTYYGWDLEKVVRFLSIKQYT